MNGVLQELGVQSDAIFRSEYWQLPIDQQEGLQMSFLYWYLELGMCSSNRNNVNRWWFGPHASQIAVSGLHYQLNRLL